MIHNHHQNTRIRSITDSSLLYCCEGNLKFSLTIIIKMKNILIIYTYFYEGNSSSVIPEDNTSGLTN